MLLRSYIADHTAFVKFYEWPNISMFVFGIKTDAMKKYFSAISLDEVTPFFWVSKKTRL